ncbi:uncharacterized protein LOC130421150 [Triplophysa dalaica]|uniref:uncharacterized protein LOC130421150 n=1 Tax=Triplophysa dalaica TaxID=1582913 RepID=UPI0024DF39C4|nr:uncharacterized protein LOC130421150 [Triplophysa dalaica]
MLYLSFSHYQELGDKSSGTADDCSFQPSSSENQSVNPSSDKEKCPHEVHCSVISCLDSCEDCSGPVSSRRWLGLTCKLCSRSWHKTCFLKKGGEMLNVELSCSEDISSDEEYTPQSSDDFIPDSRQNSDSGESPPYFKTTPAVVKSSKVAKNVPKPTYCSSTEQEMISSGKDITCDGHDPTTKSIVMLQSPKSTPTVSSDERSSIDNVSNPKDTISTHSQKLPVTFKSIKTLKQKSLLHSRSLNTPRTENGYLRSSETEATTNIIERLWRIRVDH